MRWPEQHASGPRILGIHARRLLRSLIARRELAAVARHVRSAGNLQWVLLGNERSEWHRRFAHDVRAREVVRCDDGAADAVPVGSSPATSSYHKQPSPLRWLGWPGTSSEIKPDVIFSAYPRAMDGRSEGAVVIKNNYDVLRSRLRRPSNRSGSVWFVGQPFYTTSEASVRAFIAILAFVSRTFFGGKQLCYRAHPGEDMDVVQQLAAELRWDWAPFSQPIELEVAESEIAPERMLTFFSSVFQTCHHIYGPAIPFDIIIPEPSFWPLTSVRTEPPVYRFFERQGTAPNRLLHVPAAVFSS
ncbi:hypothetical protein BDD21_3035 [Thiocapsa rosea]|uniref:Uncharacterized protein n=1 Tax=Thiocapsa rosea TaxID=69360 RepID=A0A495V832_9GAMM|nr:hypothetical protein BDD21_3035 [Thiocapsa rosea]